MVILWDSNKTRFNRRKKNTSDEFLVRKKDPLILPPDFDSLPTPLDREEAIEEISTFEEKLKKKSATDSHFFNQQVLPKNQY